MRTNSIRLAAVAALAVCGLGTGVASAQYNLAVSNQSGSIYVLNSAALTVTPAVPTVSGLGTIVDLTYGVGTTNDHLAVVANSGGTGIVTYRSLSDLSTAAKTFTYVDGEATRQFTDSTLLSNGNLALVGSGSPGSNGFQHIINDDAGHVDFNGWGENNPLTDIDAYDDGSGNSVLLRPGNGGIIRTTPGAQFAGFIKTGEGQHSEVRALGTTGIVLARRDGIVGVFDNFDNWGEEAIIFNTGTNTALDVLPNGNFVVGNAEGTVRILQRSGSTITELASLSGLRTITDIQVLPDGTFAVGNAEGELSIVSLTGVGPLTLSIASTATGLGNISSIENVGLVPEPATLGLLTAAGLLALRRRR